MLFNDLQIEKWRAMLLRNSQSVHQLCSLRSRWFVLFCFQDEFYYFSYGREFSCYDWNGVGNENVELMIIAYAYMHEHMSCKRAFISTFRRISSCNSTEAALIIHSRVQLRVGCGSTYRAYSHLSHITSLRGHQISQKLTKHNLPKSIKLIVSFFSSFTAR